MLIKEEALRHWIDNFYGYGSWHAPFWFVGHEESGGEVPEEVADKLDYFRHVPAVTDGVLCDIRALYRSSLPAGPGAGRQFANRYEHRFGDSAIQNSVWKNLIAFEHGYRGEQLPDLLSYQQHHFASPSGGNEALIRLYPLPGPHSHAWYYSWLDLPRLGFLKSRAQYEAHVYPRRIHTILTNVTKHRPEVVLMYGMTNINTLKGSVQEFFNGVRFRMLKATTRQIPQHHRMDFNGTTLLITTQVPALRHNRVETGFDWEEFGKRVKSQV